MRLSWELNQLWPYKDGGGVMPVRRAGSGVGKYIAESPKQGSKKFNSITKTIHFAHRGILFIYGLALCDEIFDHFPLFD